MTREEVFEQVRSIVFEHFDVPSIDRINNETHFYHDLGASLDIVEAFMGCEEAFGIVIPNEDAENLATVGALVDYIFSQQGGWPPAPTLPQE